ncbi:MAG: hypothetical protein ACR2PY_01960 [Salinispira sp.]
MSGIPTIFDIRKNYTVLGRGPENRISRFGLSVLQLVRDRKYQRTEDIRKIASRNFSDVIVMLPRDNILPYEELVSEFSNLRLILFDPHFYRQSSIGALINAGIVEARCEFVALVWNGVNIVFDMKLLQHMDRETLCYLPYIQDNKGRIIPSFFVPTPTKEGRKEHFVEPQPILPSENENQSLFPCDYSGIYVKERFTRCGGFDAHMNNPYWQKLEFGYRARLWGERLQHLPGLKIEYAEELQPEETTPDEDYLRFYLRILAVLYTGDYAKLPIKKFWPYFRAGNCGIPAALRNFMRERHWIKKHAYNYRFDARQMVELWGENV